MKFDIAYEKRNQYLVKVWYVKGRVRGFYTTADRIDDVIHRLEDDDEVLHYKILFIYPIIAAGPKCDQG